MKTLMKGNTKKSEILRLIAFSVICILPISAIVYGIKLLCDGWLCNQALTLSLFVIPLIIVIGSYFILRLSKIHIVLKIIVSIVFITLFSFLSFIGYMYGMFSRLESYTDASAIVKYENDYFEETALPLSNELGSYSSFEYYIFESVNIIADPCAKTVICKYDDENYRIETAKLHNNYMIQSEPIGSADHNVTIDDYEFRMLSDEVYYDYFPKYVGFVGTNDKTKEIIYIYYNDVELDYITSTEEFINEECGFKYVR